MVYEKEKADLLEKKLIEAYGEGSRVPIMKLRENDDPDIREIAHYVYENVFLKYTMKQWGQKPEEISPEVTGRVPVLISYDNRYFQDKLDHTHGLKCHIHPKHHSSFLQHGFVSQSQELSFRLPLPVFWHRLPLQFRLLSRCNRTSFITSDFVRNL